MLSGSHRVVSTCVSCPVAKIWVYTGDPRDVWWVDSTALPVCIGEKSSMAFRWIAHGVRWKRCRKLEYWGSEGRTYPILFGSSIGHSRSLHFLVDVWKGQAARLDSADMATTTADVVGVNGFESPRFDIVAARKTRH